jgi:hypothetical protein
MYTPQALTNIRWKMNNLETQINCYFPLSLFLEILVSDDLVINQIHRLSEISE